ncbi:MAG TPA: PilN domain-containing protein [Holophagaceae bacterium]|nr:PilN domain-containing protein [Holophagaceae bacterium]
MIKINLLGDALAHGASPKAAGGAAEPVALYADEGAQRSLPIAGVLIGLALASVGGAYFLWLNNEVHKLEAQQRILQEEKKQYDPYIALEAEFRKKKEDLQAKEQAITDLRRKQQLPVYFLEELANSLPDHVWFLKITQKGMTISIEGEASNFESINAFYQNLQARSRWFKKVNYPGGKVMGNKRVVDFTITFELQNAV